MRVYISGPISGELPNKSFWAFYNARQKLDRLGCDVVNPRMISHWGLSWQTYMQIAFDILNSGEIDAVYMLDGWEKSRGATLERYMARLAGIPVAYETPRAPEAGANL